MVECWHALRAYLGRYWDKSRCSIRMRHRIIEYTCTYDHVGSTEGHCKAVQAPGGRPIEIFSIDIVMRTMTGTLEALAVGTIGVSASQMDTALVERDPVGTITVLDYIFRL